MSQSPRLLAITQGDPAGIGPELLLRLAARCDERTSWRPLLIAERAALEAVRHLVPAPAWERLDFGADVPGTDDAGGTLSTQLPVVDPVGEPREVRPGVPTAADARGAMAAIERGVDLVTEGLAGALITLPVSKASIARHLDPEFRGHTDELARRAGLERYGAEYLMTFLAAGLQVALLTVHEPLVAALGRLTEQRVTEALRCLDRHAGGRLAVAGLNPHAGEKGLLGDEETEILAPAVRTVRRDGIDAVGPYPADTVFARARAGEFDWVLALYHDQGLIPVKTVAPGGSTNWTLGLPYVRTSVDHGTAFDIAGTGRADVTPLLSVVDTTLALLSGELPRGRAAC